jgi:flagellar assembly factor FliW
LRVNTKAYGSVDVDERQKISFPKGILGFEKFKDYVLLDAERQPFYWIQSLDVERVAFIIVNPFLFRPDYELDIDDSELSEIDIKDPETALIFTIVTIPSDGSPMTANLQGPLVINKEARLARQVILTDPRWKTKHDVVAELAAAKKAPC